MFGSGNDGTLIVIAVSVENIEPVARLYPQYAGEVVAGTIIKVALLVDR